MKRIYSAVLAVFAVGFMFTGQAFALGECGLSCCIGGATSSGLGLSSKFGLSVQHEYSYMKNIKHGSTTISPEQAIDENRAMNGTFSVPTEMVMEKLSVIGAYPVNERLTVLGIVPYIRNNMKMRMKMGMMGMVSDMTMDTIEGMGDITAMALYTAYTDAPVRPEKRLTLGFGVKAPTGKNDSKKSTGQYVHAMMQAGSGSWDGLFMANYMRAFYPLIFQANAFYQSAGKGDEGYKFGNQLAIDLTARRQVSDYVNLGLDLNYINAGKDTDYDGKYSNTTSLNDNTDNTGLTSILVTPVVQVKIPDSGGSFQFKYQVPVSQSVNGYQQVINWRLFSTLTWNF